MTIHVLLALALIGIILLQRSEGGLGSGFGGGSDFLSPRGTANLLTRTTAILAAGFIVTSLLITMIVEDRRDRGSIIDELGIEETASPPQSVDPVTTAPVTTAPVTTAPIEETP